MKTREISKNAWYDNGGFAHTRQFRRMHSGEWHYHIWND